MSDVVKAAFLGAIQGVTEFLPVSSSGHLIAAKTISGYEATLAFDVFLHLATLLAVLIYFRRDLWSIARSADRGPVGLRIALGTLPAVALALAFQRWREGIDPWFVVLGWSISAVYLRFTRGREGSWRHPELPILRAVIVGGTQGLAAILPGLSRSGSSISSGLWLGLKRDEASRFSFLLSIPLMAGAGLMQGRKLAGEGIAEVPGGWPALVVAFAAAFLTGIVAIHALLRVVAGDRFHRFGWYNLCAASAFALYLALH